MIRSFWMGFWVAAVLPLRAAVFQETFASDPTAQGWRTFGDTSLFQWDATNQNLRTTWDSSRTNSFFHLPLGTILGRNDSFSFGFDVRLAEIRLGSTPGKSNEFQIAVGLLNYSSATNVNAFRGSGVHSTYGVKNLVEFNFFPDSGFGDTFASVVVSTNNRIYPAHNFPLPLTTGDMFRVMLSYTASNQTLRTTATRNGSPYGLPPNNALADLSMTGKADFRVDSFAVISYSDAIQFGPPSVHGSIRAQGVVDNIEWNVPPAPIQDLYLRLAGQTWQARFQSQSNWTYTLERSSDLERWSAASGPAPGNGSSLSLSDTNGVGLSFFYRVRSERP